MLFDIPANAEHTAVYVFVSHLVTSTCALCVYIHQYNVDHIKRNQNFILFLCGRVHSLKVCSKNVCERESEISSQKQHPLLFMPLYRICLHRTTCALCVYSPISLSVQQVVVYYKTAFDFFSIRPLNTHRDRERYREIVYMPVVVVSNILDEAFICD